ncbi:MAG: hypothetical protein K8R64_05765 [Methanosarcinaceae archaeon]|nr:hypothetical protein [Methanosarcinaceae archaeon]
MTIIHMCSKNDDDNIPIICSGDTLAGSMLMPDTEDAARMAISMNMDIIIKNPFKIAFRIKGIQMLRLRVQVLNPLFNIVGMFSGISKISPGKMS